MSNTIEVNDFVYGNIGRGRKDRGKIYKGGKEWRKRFQKNFSMVVDL